jgi:hypothetical protein
VVLMTSASICDPVADHLITPQNTAIVVINYRPLSVAHRRVLSRKRAMAADWARAGQTIDHSAKIS